MKKCITLQLQTNTTTDILKFIVIITLQTYYNSVIFDPHKRYVI